MLCFSKYTAYTSIIIDSSIFTMLDVRLSGLSFPAFWLWPFFNKDVTFLTFWTFLESGVFWKIRPDEAAMSTAPFFVSLRCKSSLYHFAHWLCLQWVWLPSFSVSKSTPIIGILLLSTIHKDRYKIFVQSLYHLFYFSLLIPQFQPLRAQSSLLELSYFLSTCGNSYCPLSYFFLTYSLISFYLLYIGFIIWLFGYFLILPNLLVFH